MPFAKNLIAVTLLAGLLIAAGGNPAKANEHTVLEYGPSLDLKVFGSQPSETSMVTGVDGRPALRIDVNQRGEKNWSALHHSPTNTKLVRKDDLIVFEMEVRVTGERTQEGSIGVYAESAVKEKKGSIGDQIHPTTELRKFRRSVVSPGDYDPGEFILSVHLAIKPQVIEFYGAKMEVYPAGTDPKLLRLDGVTWDGRSLDAAWRKEANARIEKLRKQDVEVSVIDSDGNPVEGAEIKIDQTKHAWRFGTFVGNKMLGDSDEAKRYREAVKSRYNFVTLPAYLANWGWLNERSREQYFALADWAQANSMDARGHLLVYPGWTSSPSEWFTIPKAELREKLEAHIPRAIAAFQARGVTEWDVTNELRFNKQFMEEIGGLEVAADWFKIARKHLPEGDLYLNETIILPNGGHTETEQQTLEDQFGELIKLGAPIDGIGLQGHFGSELTAPTRVLEILDRMAKLGRPIMITEFDMDNDDVKARGDYVRDFYTACFSHPAVKGIVAWGFWEGDMWKPRGHLLTKDWQETPASHAYEDLVLKQWQTHESGKTDSAGRWNARGFKGTHTVTVSRGGYTWTRNVELNDNQLKLQVIVP